jgi:hypothetical protein
MVQAVSQRTVNTEVHIRSQSMLDLLWAAWHRDGLLYSGWVGCWMDASQISHPGVRGFESLSKAEKEMAQHCSS